MVSGGFGKVWDNKNSSGVPFERIWDFEAVFGRIFNDFGRHLGAQMMIRATKGTSRRFNWNFSWIVGRGPKRLDFWVRCGPGR